MPPPLLPPAEPPKNTGVWTILCICAALALVCVAVLLGGLLLMRGIRSQSTSEKAGNAEVLVEQRTHEVERNPNNPQAYNDRGLARRTAGDLDGAIADFNRAIELDPKREEVFGLNRAEARIFQADYAGAVADCDRILTTNTQLAKALATRALARALQGDAEGAMADANRAIEIEPHAARAYIARGHARAGKSDFTGAFDDCNQAIEITHNDAWAFYVRGMTHLARYKSDDDHYDALSRERNDLRKAEDDFRTAIQLNPSFAQAYNGRGEIQIIHRKWRDAVTEFGHAIDLNPKYADAYAHRGEAQADVGDAQSAVADFNRAVDLHTRHRGIFTSRGVSHMALGHWKEALADFRHSAESPTGDDEFAHLYIWLVRARLGETEAASRELSAYLQSRPGKNNDDWLATAAGFLLGKVARDEMMHTAESMRLTSTGDLYKKRSRTTQAWYLDGMQKLFAGNEREAARSFDMARFSNPELPEGQLAQAELARLAK